jgi:L-malate glycosyltransferase
MVLNFKNNITLPQTSQRDQKINILVATDHGGYKGNLAGIGRNLSYILPHIDKTRFNIILVVLRDAGSLKSRLQGTGIKIINLRRKKFDPFILYDFIKIIKTENVRLIHLYQYASSNFGRLAGKISGVPVILNANDENYDYPWYQWFADRLLKNIADYVIAVSEAVKSSCAKIRAIDLCKIMVIPNAVSNERFKHLDHQNCQELKKQWGVKEESPIVGTVTRLHDVKANDVFINAAKIVLHTLPDTWFIIVGDGPQMEPLKKIAAELGIEKNIIFTGYQEDVAGFLSIFNVVAVASDTEGCSLALLEAMLMKKAIVATEVGGIKELLQQGDTGLLVPPQNPQKLAEKIIYLLQNEDERERLGLNAFNESKKYSVENHIKMREKLYEKALRDYTFKIE